MLLKLFILMCVSSSVVMGASAANPTSEGISEDGFQPDLQKLFPASSLTDLQTLMNNEGVSIPVPGPQKNTDVGFNQTKLSALHCQVLEAAKGKNVYELGSGCGYFTAKLLVAGAKFVTAIDLSKDAIEQRTPQIIAQYEKALSKSFKDQYRLTYGDVSDVLEKFIKMRTALGDKVPSPDVMTMINLLHYLTPNTAKEALAKARGMATPSTQLYILVNVPWSTDVAVDTYLTAKKRASPFPGYLMLSRTDTLICKEGEGKVLGKLSTVYTDSCHLSEDEDISPTKLDTDGKATPAGKDGFYAKVTVSIKQAFFFWDMETARRLLGAAGWQITDAYYLDEKSNKVPEFDGRKTSKKPLSLAVIASPL